MTPTESQRIAAEMPSRERLAEAEATVKKVWDVVARLRASTDTRVSLTAWAGSGATTWCLGRYGDTDFYRCPHEYAAEMTLSTDEAIAARKAELEGERDEAMERVSEADAALESLRSLEIGGRDED